MEQIPPENSKRYSNDHDLEKNARLSKYWILNTLGEGSYSKVKLGIDSTTGQRVAIKIIKSTFDENQALELWRSEINALGKIREHPFIMKLREAGQKMYYRKVTKDGDNEFY